MMHDELIETARIALRAVFGDTSVDQETTRDSLEMLADEIDSMIAALEVDI